jgi:hypothetical protein
MALVLVAAAAACNNGDRDAADTARFSADTSITERTVQDTTIVTHDTVIRSDTIIRPGGTTSDSAAGRGRARRP